ncbi:RING-H2 finger protein ATL2A [Hordeum vulgare]|nr:RING-H2 finger protein ATL2A [Hordeum vulgare]
MDVHGSVIYILAGSPMDQAAKSPKRPACLVVVGQTSSLASAPSMCAATGARQTGQVGARVSSQRSTHSRWKPWRHAGSTRTSSPAAYSARHTAQASSSSACCSPWPSTAASGQPSSSRSRGWSSSTTTRTGMASSARLVASLGGAGPGRPSSLSPTPPGSSWRAARRQA